MQNKIEETTENKDTTNLFLENGISQSEKFFSINLKEIYFFRLIILLSARVEPKPVYELTTQPEVLDTNALPIGQRREKYEPKISSKSRIFYQFWQFLIPVATKNFTLGTSTIITLRRRNNFLVQNDNSPISASDDDSFNEISPEDNMFNISLQSMESKGKSCYRNINKNKT